MYYSWAIRSLSSNYHVIYHARVIYLDLFIYLFIYNLFLLLLLLIFFFQSMVATNFKIREKQSQLFQLK